MDTASEEEMIRLMDTYARALAGTCYALLADYHLTQDVVQETFIKAWRQGPLIRQTERAWLLRVAVNGCRDIRRSRYMRWVDRRIPPEELPLPAPEPLQSALLDEVHRLPVKEREVIVMRYWNDLSAEEIADILGVGRATVYRRLDRACKRLRIDLEGGENA